MEPAADVELLCLAWQFLQAVGVADVVQLALNSLGDAPSRTAYTAALTAYLPPHADALSSDSQARLLRNPLRILDSKDPRDQALLAEAPVLHHFYTPEATRFWHDVQEGLTKAGIPYTVAPRLVRGMDYYDHTAFEFTTDYGLGTQNTIMAGGRYHGLVQALGGPSVPGVGCAAGIERIAVVREAKGIMPQVPRTVAVVPLSASMESHAFGLVRTLREAYVPTLWEYNGNASKRLKHAHVQHAYLALLVEETLWASDRVRLRHLGTGQEEDIPVSHLLTHVARHLQESP
jgi:histidyl-tRNA synthetase